jgi:hypothetical protein
MENRSNEDSFVLHSANCPSRASSREGRIRLRAKGQPLLSDTGEPRIFPIPLASDTGAREIAAQADMIHRNGIDAIDQVSRSRPSQN